MPGGPALRLRLIMAAAKLHERSFIDFEELHGFTYAFDMYDGRDECWAEVSATGWWNQLAGGAQAYLWFAPRAWFSVDADPIESFGVSVQIASAEAVLEAPEFLAAARASGVRVGTYWGQCPSLSLSTPVAYGPLREGIEPLDEFARHALLQLYNCAPPGFDKDARPLGRFAPPQLYRSGPAGKTLETASLTE